jgi:hypothetical protein
MTPAEQEYVRYAARLLLQASAERDARERASRCGTAASLDGFEGVLAERLRGKGG